MGAEFVVEGNFEPRVITEPFLYTGKEQVERLLAVYEGKQLNVYNCSNGVKMKGTFPLRSHDIMLEDISLAKNEIVEHVKLNAFEKYENDVDLSSLLLFDQFQQICETMVEILETDFSSREEALDILFKHLNYLNSFSQDRQFSHLYLLLQGEAWYVNSVLVSLLYNYGDSQEIVPHFKASLAVWRDFLKQAPQMYRERWNELSDYGFDYKA